jgi:hypothetical protein
MEVSSGWWFLVPDGPLLNVNYSAKKRINHYNFHSSGVSVGKLKLLVEIPFAPHRFLCRDVLIHGIRATFMT